jgi:hypothetical protein
MSPITVLSCAAAAAKLRAAAQSPVRPMPRRAGPALARLAAAMLLLGGPVLAQAAQWRYLEPQGSTPLKLSRVIPGGGGDYWLLDGNALRHIDAGGTLRTLQRSVEPAGFGDSLPGYRSHVAAAYAMGYATSNGSAMFDDLAACRLLRIETGLRPTWQLLPYNCKGLDANADGVFWVRTLDQIDQYGPDGVMRRTSQFIFPEARHRPTVVKAQADGGALTLSVNAVLTITRVTRFDAQGQRRWSWVSPEPRQSLTAIDDGGAYAAGLSGNTLAVTRLNADGGVVWSRQVPVTAEVILSMAAADNALYVATGDSPYGPYRPNVLLRLGGDGAVNWQQAFCPDASPTNPPAGAPELAVGADGSITHFCLDGTGPRLLRRDAAGMTTASVAMPFSSVQQLQQAGDGRLLVLGRAQGGSQLVSIDAAGEVHSTVVENLADRASLRLWAATLDASDSTYLQTQADALLAPRGNHSISKVLVDGSRAWRTEIPSFGLLSARLAAGHGLICGGESARIAAIPGSVPIHRAWCLDSSDGRSLFQAETPITATMLRVRPLEGGRSVAFTAMATGYTITVRDRQGLVTGSSAHPGSTIGAAIDDRGRTTVVRADKVIQYDSDGTIRFSIANQLAARSLSDPMVTDDGSVFLTGEAPGQNWRDSSLWAIAPDGNTRWTTPLRHAREKSRLLARRCGLSAAVHRRDRI